MYHVRRIKGRHVSSRSAYKEIEAHGDIKLVRRRAEYVQVGCKTRLALVNIQI